MSHLDGQPLEVPERVVADLIAGIGAAKTEHIWAGKATNDEWEAEIRDRERRRARLGGFGFRSTPA